MPPKELQSNIYLFILSIYESDVNKFSSKTVLKNWGNEHKKGSFLLLFMLFLKNKNEN